MSTIRNQYWNFVFKKKKKFKNTKKCSYFLNFGQMWLVNELAFTFWAPLNYEKTQFNPIILSRVIVFTAYYYRQIDTFVKTVFSDSFISNIIFHIKLIPSHLWWESKKIDGILINDHLYSQELLQFDGIQFLNINKLMPNIVIRFNVLN